MKRTWILYLFILGSMPFGLSAETDSLTLAQGETLFTQNCKACHHLEMRLVGPALQGVNDRHPLPWLLKFIRSSQTMIQSGDSAAVALFNTYNSVIMPDQSMNEEEIKSILEYIRASKKAGPAPGEIQRPVATQPVAYARPLKFSDYRFWILYTITVLLVIVSIYYKAELIALRKDVESRS